MSELYTAGQIGKEAGVLSGTWGFHKKKGKIPGPAVAIGGRAYYTAEQREAILAFYKTWVRWQHDMKREVV